MNKLFRPILFLFCAVFAIGCTTPEKEVYMFSYFTDNGQDGLHLAYSLDGKEWLTLNGGDSFLAPELGKDRLMRDPSITQGKDGKFHMVWTTGWWDRGIGYASSSDLINWSPQQNIPVMEWEPTTRNTWAPELFYDEADDLFYIIWASTIPGKHTEVNTTEHEKGLNHRQYYTTTRDFITFAPTQRYFDPSFSVIDGAIIKRDKEYWFIVKNENSMPAEKNLHITFTNDLKKGFPVEVSDNISGKSWVEGPAPLLVGDSVYVYFDKYMEGHYGAIRSKDGRQWDDVSDEISFPKGVRHGTAFTVKSSVFEELKKNLTK